MSRTGKAAIGGGILLGVGALVVVLLVVVVAVAVYVM
jgi:hypothetical protein